MQSSASTAFADLSTFTFWNVSYTSKYLILESVERYSSLNPTGGRYLSLQTARRPAGRGHRQLRRRAPTRSRSLDVANRYVLNGASFAPGRPRRALTEPDRRRPRHAGQPADPGRRHGGQRDHGLHLRGRRRQARLRCATAAACWRPIRY